MGEGRGREISGASVRREGEDMQGREMGMHEKIASKRNILGIWGRPVHF